MSDDENDALDRTIDSTTFGIPQNSQRSSKAETKSIISSSVETNRTNFLSAKSSFDSLDTHNSPVEETSHFSSPTKSTISLFGTDVLAFFSPSSKVDTEETDNISTMPKTVAKGTMPPSEEEPHFDAATQ